MYLTGGTDLFLPFLPLFVVQYKEQKEGEVGNHAINQNAGYMRLSTQTGDIDFLMTGL